MLKRVELVERPDGSLRVELTMGGWDPVCYVLSLAEAEKLRAWLSDLLPPAAASEES